MRACVRVHKILEPEYSQLLAPPPPAVDPRNCGARRKGRGARKSGHNYLGNAAETCEVGRAQTG